jgi:hypothetical protein
MDVKKERKKSKQASEEVFQFETQGASPCSRHIESRLDSYTRKSLGRYAEGRV